MDKTTAIKLISRDIYRTLTLEKNCRENLNLKLKLIPLIDKIKEENNINHEINIDEVLIQLKKDNEEYHSNIEIFIKNQTYFVYFKKSDINIEEFSGKDSLESDLEKIEFLDVTVLKDNTKTIIYSAFIFFNILIISNIFPKYGLFIQIIFLILLMTLKDGMKVKKISLLFYISIGFTFINSQNLYVLIPVAIIYSIPIMFLYFNDRSNSIKQKEDDHIGLIIACLILFLLGFSWIMTMVSNSFLDVKSYIYIKSLIIISLSIIYVYINKFDILQTALFTIISISTYNLISKIMQTLDEKEILFHPYLEKINFDYSLLSISITIIILSIPTINIFIKSIRATINLKLLIPITLSYILILALIYKQINTFYYLNIFIFCIFIFFTLYMILNLGTDENHKYTKKFKYIDKYITLNEIKLSVMNKSTFIDYFYKSLKEQKNIKFNQKLYLENIAFIVISSMFISSFVFNYNHIYHYKKVQNLESCIKYKYKDEKYIYLNKEENNLYILHENKDNKTKNKADEKLKEKIIFTFTTNIDTDTKKMDVEKINCN